jgi:DNA-binding NtrC family response regulator
MDHAASRDHVRLEPRGEGRVAIVDLGSRNGTFVDGRRVARAELEPGSIVRVGDTVLRIAALTDEPSSPIDRDGLVGGTALAPLRRTLNLIAPTELSVLVLGETGTGKDVVARAVHAASKRSGPFIAVNCAALPDALIESELFGHARGSFTGANTSRRGLILEAEGGTLFLDEIGELPLAAQAKLLRVLEDHSVRPVGSEHEQRVNVRIVCATNRDLHARAQTGEFRADLLARLAGVELRLPPLRARIEDLPALIQALWRRTNRRGVEVSANALEALALYAWPHNIRELEHTLRAAALVDTARLDVDALPAAIQEPLREARRLATEIERTRRPGERRDEIEAALVQHDGNLRRVAHSLGIARGHLYRLMKRWNLEAATYRRAGTGTNPALRAGG